MWRVDGSELLSLFLRVTFGCALSLPVSFSEHTDRFFVSWQCLLTVSLLSDTPYKHHYTHMHKHCHTLSLLRCMQPAQLLLVPSTASRSQASCTQPRSRQ